MLLWRLLLVFTYQGRVRRYCSEPPLAFPWTKTLELLKRLMVGQAVPEIPLSIGSKLELLRAAWPNFHIHVLSRALTHLSAYAYVLPCMCTYNYTCVYMTEAPRVLHFSAFILYSNTLVGVTYVNVHVYCTYCII